MRKQYKSKNKFGLNRDDFGSYKEYRKEYARLRSQTKEYKEAKKAYEQSDKRKAYMKAYRQSEVGKASQKKYDQSEKGKARDATKAAKRRAIKLQRMEGLVIKDLVIMDSRTGEII